MYEYPMYSSTDLKDPAFGSCTHSDCNKRSNAKFTRDTCFTPASNQEICVWWQATEDAYFDTISMFGGYGTASFMSAIGIVSIVFYFVTSSDSGSYVVDIISANGDTNPPVIQKVFWSLTEGICAAALVYAGK